MYNISLITGDGIGPELSESAIAVLETIHDKLGLKFSIKKLQAGDSALKQTGKALPEETLESVKQSYACLIAEQRNQEKKVTCVHKSNVMRKTDGLFVRSCEEEIRNHSGITFEQMYVDACAMNLIRQPQSFDVIVTTNLFGDILSDEAAQVVGGLGMAPAANIGDNFALFEPVHGAAFDIAGKQIANPSSFILSIKMMLEWLGMKNNDKKCFDVAGKLESTICDIVKHGIKTKDIGGDKTTREFTKEIISRLA